MAGPPPDYAMMARLMASECEAVVEAFAITAYHEGGELHAHLSNGMHIAMALRGTRRGKWLDKSDNRGGSDPLELVHRVLGQPDHRVAFDWGKQFFGVGNQDALQALAARREVVTARQHEAQADKLSLIDRVRRGVSRYLGGNGARSVQWPNAPELFAYLLGRGIRCAETLPLKTLRFSRAQFHTETEREWPAMLAPIVDPESRSIIAAHITFLDGERDTWRKAPIEPPKKVTASYLGGIIPLLRGHSGKPLKFAPDNEAVMIGEGIENSLAASIMLAPGEIGGIDPPPRVFAGVTAGNLQHIKMPPQVAEVYLVCDRWQPGYENPAVERAYQRAEQNWLDAGLAVQRCWPPKGYKDFADALVANNR